MAGPINQETI